MIDAIIAFDPILFSPRIMAKSTSSMLAVNFSGYSRGSTTRPVKKFQPLRALVIVLPELLAESPQRHLHAAFVRALLDPFVRDGELLGLPRSAHSFCSCRTRGRLKARLAGLLIKYSLRRRYAENIGSHNAADVFCPRHAFVFLTRDSREVVGDVGF